MKAYIKYLKIDEINNIELAYLNLPSDIRKHVRLKKNELHFRQSVVAWNIVLEYGKKIFNLDEINFSFSENGKPFVTNGLFNFSISHSDEYVAVVLSNTNVGIDIQNMKKNRDYDYLCKLEVSAKLQDKSIFSCSESDIVGVKYYTFDFIKKYMLVVGSLEQLDIVVL